MSPLGLAVAAGAEPAKGTETAAGAGEDRAPWRVERGRPGRAELAALVAVLVAAGRSTAPAAAHARAPSPWAHPRGLVRQTPVAGAGAWRESALPSHA